ncbi:hypothetical protein BDZ91DRAFT_844249, partial [Kalaharituber pfeilii]
MATRSNKFETLRLRATRAKFRHRPPSFPTHPTLQSGKLDPLANTSINGFIESLKILSSRQRTTEDSDAVEVILNVEPSNEAEGLENGPNLGSTNIRWIHLHQPHFMDLESFRKVALQQPGLTDEDQLIIHHLFKKVRSHEKPTIDSRFFRYLRPDVIKIKGSYSDNPAATSGTDEPEMSSAEFICFPYFSLQGYVPPKTHLPMSTGTGRMSLQSMAIHPPRTLLQSQYDMESTEEQDQQQARKQQRETQDSRLIHVPQLWALIFGKNFLLTCATLPLMHLFGETIFVDDAPKEEDVGFVVKLTDHRTYKSHLIRLGPDKTWLEFLYRVELLKATGALFFDTFDELQFTSTSGESITEAQWPTVVYPVNEIEIILRSASTRNDPLWELDHHRHGDTQRDSSPDFYVDTPIRTASPVHTEAISRPESPGVGASTPRSSD